MKIRRMLLAALAAGLLAGQAAGQLPAVAEGDDILPPERLEKLLQQAKVQRMSMERDQVAVEIREGLLFDPEKITAAIQALEANPQNTWQDNVDRICKAFAMVDLRFAKAWQALSSGNYDPAAETLKSLLSRRDSSYLAAARWFCYGDALAAGGKLEDAVDVYTELFRLMPDRFSFASMALLRAAETYEKMHRRYYAMTLYRAWVDSYGLLEPALAEELFKKAQVIEAAYRDPLGTVAVKMTEAQEGLARTDSGRETQKRQKDVIEMLDDLIAMAEEQSGGQGQGSSQGRCPNCGGQCQGQCQQGRGQGQSGGRSGPAQGIGVPSSPATSSRLPSGASPRPQNLREVRPSDPSDDWGRLPPEQQQKLLESFRESMPERYRDMISDYYRRLAAQQQR